MKKHLPYIYVERRWMPLKADTVTKDYVKDAGVFADIFNYYIYGGRQEQIIGIEYRLCQIICSGYFMYKKYKS